MGTGSIFLVAVEGMGTGSIFLVAVEIWDKDDVEHR